jgi:hypothetical protein
MLPAQCTNRESESLVKTTLWQTRDTHERDVAKKGRLTGMQRENDGEQVVPGSVRVGDVRQVDLKTHLSLEHGRAAGSPSVLDPKR